MVYTLERDLPFAETTQVLQTIYFLRCAAKFLT